MPIVDPKEIERIQEEQATIKEVPGGYKGPYLPHVYDSRSECWRENIKEAERRRLEKDGRDINGQTADQRKAFEIKKKKSEEIKRKAEVAAEMVAQNR